MTKPLLSDAVDSPLVDQAASAANDVRTPHVDGADIVGERSGPPFRWRWIALFVVLAAEIVDLLDALITVIAGPSIVADLGGGETMLQWLSAAYTLAMATGVLLGGRLGDLYGRQRMFLIGMGGFTLFSLACAMAQDPAMLIGARILQGLFGAMMLPQGLGLIKEMFPPPEMAKAFGAFGPVMGIAAVGGPILGGWLIHANLLHLGWRAIFAINVPLGIAALVAGVRFLPANRPQRTLRLDLVGVLLAGTGMALLVYPLVQGREQGWPLWCFAMLAGAAVVFGLFVATQRRRDRAGLSTLVVPSLFRQRAFLGGMATGLAFFISLMGTGLVFTLFVQLGLGFSPLKAGVAGLPQAAGMIVGFGIAQAFNARLGRTLMMIGIPLVAAGLIGLALTISGAGPVLTIWQMTPAMAAVGIGMGMTMAPFFDIVLAGVSDRESGSASGTLTALQQVGGATGVAVLGTILFSAVGSSGATSVTGAFGYGTQVTLWAAAGITLVALPLTLLLPRHARPDTPGH